MKKIRSYTSIWSVEKVLYSINDFRLPFPITFTQMTWFVVSLFAVMILGNLPPLSIKYIENNLVWNKDGECYAYYELVPYNYSFLSPEQKIQVHDSFRQLIAQNRDGKIHALQISTESSILSAQERSKNEVTGKLKTVAYDKIDQQTDALISMIGENQVDYRFFIGFKLLLNDQEFSMKSLTVDGKAFRK